jgi:hypothetical protein
LQAVYERPPTRGREEGDGDIEDSDLLDNLLFGSCGEGEDEEEENNEENGEDCESLLYGFRNNQILSTQLLLTIGRAYDERLDFVAGTTKKNLLWRKTSGPSCNREAKNNGRLGGGKSRLAAADDSPPFLQLFYKRLAPRAEVFFSLSPIYDLLYNM